MKKHLNFTNTCGYVTFVRTGVKDIGCEKEVADVKLQRPQRRKSSGKVMQQLKKKDLIIPAAKSSGETMAELLSPNDDVDISTFQKKLSSHEDHFAKSSGSGSPANEYRSVDCDELLESELDKLSSNARKLISEASIEIPISEEAAGEAGEEEAYEGEDWTILEVQFGVPLFDFDCNSRICQGLATRLLAEEKYVAEEGIC